MIESNSRRSFACGNNRPCQPMTRGRSRFCRVGASLLSLSLSVLFVGRFAFADAIVPELESINPSGSAGNSASIVPVLSDDGRFVVFTSVASDLVSSDANSQFDVFLRDRLLGTTTLVSKSVTGTSANGSSGSDSSFTGTAMSPDGSLIAFVSDASNLVSGDTNGSADIFLYDAVNLTTSRVSVRSGGTESNGDSAHPTLSADGRYVAFSSRASNLVNGDTNNVEDVFIRDTSTPSTYRISVSQQGVEGNGASTAPSISNDGRFVVFVSAASNLVPNDTNGVEDVFIYDQSDASITRITRPDGVQFNGRSYEPAISGDGNWIVFSSEASNVTADDKSSQPDVFVYNRQSGALKLIPPRFTFPAGTFFQVNFFPAIDRTGHFITVNSYSIDAVIYDNVTGVASIPSVKSTLLNVALSGGGDYIAYTSPLALTPKDLNGTFDIYLEPRPQIITARPQLTQPPLVQVTGTSAIITLQPFGTVFTPVKKTSHDELARDEVDADSRPGSARARPSKTPPITATYVVFDKGPSGKVLKRTSRKNQIALTNLAIGQHSVNYQIITYRGTKKVGKSNISPSQTYTIGAPG